MEIDLRQLLSPINKEIKQKVDRRIILEQQKMNDVFLLKRYKILKFLQNDELPKSKDGDFYSGSVDEYDTYVILKTFCDGKTCDCCGKQLTVFDKGDTLCRECYNRCFDKQEKIKIFFATDISSKYREYFIKEKI